MFDKYTLCSVWKVLISLSSLIMCLLGLDVNCFVTSQALGCQLLCSEALQRTTTDFRRWQHENSNRQNSQPLKLIFSHDHFSECSFTSSTTFGRMYERNPVRATEFCRSKMWNLNSTKTSIFCAKNKVPTNPPALGNIQDISPRTNFIVTMWRYHDRNDRSMKIHQLLIRRLIDHLFCSV